MPRFNALPRAFFFSTDMMLENNSEIKEMFQCPTSGFLLFYKLQNSKEELDFIVFQCPTSGFLLFYFELWRSVMRLISVFQCPTSGFLLFYKKMAIQEKNTLLFVSMPYLGLSSFLPEMTTTEKEVTTTCFNALPRAFFFSTLRLASNQCSLLLEFQCPTSGFLLFYLPADWAGLRGAELFQCPTSGFLLFYAMSLHPLNLLALQIHFCV